MPAVESMEFLDMLIKLAYENGSGEPELAILKGEETGRSGSYCR